MGAQRAAAEELFYHGKNGSGQCIHSDINARLDAACNLITVAGRYMQSGDEKVAALEQATQALQSAEGISALYAANQALDEPTEALYQALNALSLSDRDESLVQKQYVNFTSPRRFHTAGQLQRIRAPIQPRARRNARLAHCLADRE